MPVGYYFCLLHEVTLGKIFIAIYGVLATYFSCVMIRLMLTLAPIVCVIAGIAVSEIFTMAGASIRHHFLEGESDQKDAEFQKVEKPELQLPTTPTKLKTQVTNAPAQDKKQPAVEVKRRLPTDAAVGLAVFLLMLLC